MDAFRTHQDVVDNYREYLKSFIKIADGRINNEVEKAFQSDGFIPMPLVQFNPAFERGESLSDLVASNQVHPHLETAIGSYKLYRHQIEALKIGLSNQGFVVTSGTGSGKSLTFLATIFNHLFSLGANKKKGVKAILVYPMNALINSQEEEIKKYAENFGANFPITYAKYSGQEKQEFRDWVKENEPDIILTNYMMLELIMTRQSEAWLRKSMKSNLLYLAFDEMHTYRGRQGADVSMLIRRIRTHCSNQIICMGTSATMSSAGTPLQKKESVAQVATTIFGKTYNANQIVQEYLEPCTLGNEVNALELREAFLKGIDSGANEVAFVEHPITNWLEMNIALRNNEGSLERGKPITLKDITARVEQATELDAELIMSVLHQTLQWAETLNERNRLLIPRRSYLPFRFHQFVSQTSTVSVTLESRQRRSITIQAGRYILDEEGEKTLYPVLFSRYSGVDFICVTRDFNRKLVVPRNPQQLNTVNLSDLEDEELIDESFTDGYIVLDEGEDYWKDDFQEYAPLEWFDKKGEKLKREYELMLPKPIYFNSKGEFSDKPNLPIKGYFIPAKLRFDPTAGVVYQDHKTNESTKLMSLGHEGRSTATTIMSFAIIDSLAKQGEKLEDQKLMSFTDNRQDASLQSGHFNDFLATVRLRAGLYKALLSNTDGLDVHSIADRVADTLALTDEKYAVQPSQNPKYPDADNTKAFKLYLLYRIFQDLKRGWRYTLPNLEQTALMNIRYRNIDTLAFDNEEFEHIPYMALLPGEVRLEILNQVLMYFRSKFAIHHRIINENRSETEQLLKNKLHAKKMWSLDEHESMEAPQYLVPSSPGRSKQKGVYFSSIGSQSSLGKYIIRVFNQHGVAAGLSKDEYKTFMLKLCDKLTEINILHKQEGILGSNGKADGYLLKTDMIIWCPGDRNIVPVDKTVVNSYQDIKLTPNPYFQKLYQIDFDLFKKEIISGEHTGQLSSDQRIIREDMFKKGEIASLFCSPTMELGIDVRNLNVVHMRNVPPNPANYAQRSGRAGRSGQTATVFTFCSAYSPHDQNYFKAQDTMVAGNVLPPRIDLKNEEMMAAHFNAYILMEIALAELNTSVVDVIDIADPANIQLKETIVDTIRHQLSLHGAEWGENFKSVIAAMDADLRKTHWYNDVWIGNKLNTFVDRFRKAFDRWIALFRNANDMLARASAVINNMTFKAQSIQITEAKRQQAVALKQLGLLKNESSRLSDNESEFYIFRYLASEGFLPGYNFTRLPIRTFVGYRAQNEGEFLSRPRSVALKEFGPHNLLYHNGSKYRVKRMNALDIETQLRTIKISNATGYAFLDDEAKVANVDPITMTPLAGDGSTYRTIMIEQSESEASPVERISCIEEERTSSGYDIREYFNYPQGMDSTKQLMLKYNEADLINFIYGPSTDLIKVNWKPSRVLEEGYSIDKSNGNWLFKKDLERPEILERRKDVIPFIRETADTIYIQPLSTLKLSKQQCVSLSFALKRGIEQHFQIEENEMGVRIMGDDDNLSILLYEAAQGSMGILSQLILTPTKLRLVFMDAYRAMHYDVATREQTELGKTLPKASYSDLLSYSNQRQHDELDRHAIKETLETLMDCDFDVLTAGRTREQQFEYLMNIYDKSSATEKPFIEYLYRHGLALPDVGQKYLKDFYLSADFIYLTGQGSVIVFCDGTAHDKPVQMEKDKRDRALLTAAGIDFIVWHHKTPLEDVIRSRGDIFKKVV